MDELATLRRRLFDRAQWFRANAGRLPDAQRARHADPTWALRRAAGVDAVIAAPRALAAAPDDLAEALLELEVLDEAAALLAGARPPTPPTVIEETFVVRLARARAPLAGAQLGSLASHLRFHALVPTRIDTPSAQFRVRLAQAPDLGKAAARRGAVSIATLSFGDDARLGCDDAGSFCSVPTAAARRAALADALTEAVAAGVDIFVAPELTVPPAERDRLLRGLADTGGPELLVPGSFHEAVRLRDGTTRTVHRALLVDRLGNQRLEHRKIAPYGRFDRDPVERFTSGDEIAALLTPIGMVALAICKDFCDDALQAIWQELQPEWLLVPAYGEGERPHAEAAKRIARMYGTITILAHEPLHSTRAGAHSFVHHRERTERNDFAPAFSRHDLPLAFDLAVLAPPDRSN